MRMVLPEYLERTPSTTNAIEFVNGRIRATTQREEVERRRDGDALATSLSSISPLHTKLTNFFSYELPWPQMMSHQARAP